MLLFLDLETTGFDNKKDNILEISAVRYDEEKKEIVDKFDRILNLPDEVEVSPMIEGLTGISTEMCRNDGISMSQCQQEFSNFILDDDIITGHNISFDTGFLNEYGFLDASTYKHKEIDTFILSVLVLGQSEDSHALEVLSKKYGIQHTNAHRAMSDVLANLDFYCVLENIYARKFSENFEKFLSQYHFDFNEKYFFDAVKGKRNILLQEKNKEILPTSSDNLSVSSPVAKKDRSDFFEASLKEKKNFFIETNAAREYTQSLFSSAILLNKNVSIFYPNKQKEEMFEIWKNIQKNSHYSQKIEFFAPREQLVSSKKFLKFLQKESFNKNETIVACKIFRAQEMGEEMFLRFMGDEWKSAREILGREEEDYSHIPFKILPFSESLVAEKNQEIRVFLGGEDLENHLLDQHQKKSFSKRVLEDFEKSSQEKKTEIARIFSQLSQSLRKEKGENQYTINVQWRDFVKMDCFTTAKKSLEEYSSIYQFSDQEAFNLQIWISFFDSPLDDEIKQIDLYRDNALGIVLTNPFFENAFEKMESVNESTLFLGKSFPKDFSGKISLSFPLPEEKQYECVADKKYLPSSLFVPGFSRDATPQEIADCIKTQWEHHPQINWIVSLTSQKNISEVKEFLREDAEKRGIKIFSRDNGGRGKIKNMMKNFSQKIIIGNTKFIEGLDCSPKYFSGLFIHKVQFDHPKHPLIQAQRKRFNNDFEEFSIPRAASRLERDIFQFSQSELGENMKIVLGDGRIGDEKSFYSQFQKILPEEVSLKKWEEM